MTRDEALDLLPCLVCGDLAPEAAARLRILLQEDPELRRVALELEESQELCLERLERRAPEAARWPRGEEEEAASKTRSWVKTLAIASLVLLGMLWAGAALLQLLL